MPVLELTIECCCGQSAAVRDLLEGDSVSIVYLSQFPERVGLAVFI